MPIWVLDERDRTLFNGTLTQSSGTRGRGEGETRGQKLDED